MSASPAAGPSRIATATARFSSTTGDGLDAQQHVVEPDDLRPVGRGGGRRLGVHRRDRRLQRVGAEAPRRQRPLDERRALGDLLAVPQRAVLVVEQDELARPATCARRAATRAAASARAGPIASGSGSSSTSSRPSRIASPERSCRVSDVARRRRVALVEDEVDDVQHRVEPLGQLAARRAPGRGCARRGSSPWRARSAARASAAAVEERARDLLGREAADLAQRQRDLRVRRAAPGGSR